VSSPASSRQSPPPRRLSIMRPRLRAGTTSIRSGLYW
jgi:hypothetical protein